MDNEDENETGERARLTKYFPCSHEDLSMVPRIHMLKPGVVAEQVILALDR